VPNVAPVVLGVVVVVPGVAAPGATGLPPGAGARPIVLGPGKLLVAVVPGAPLPMLAPVPGPVPGLALGLPLTPPDAPAAPPAAPPDPLPPDWAQAPAQPSAAVAIATVSTRVNIGRSMPKGEWTLFWRNSLASSQVPLRLCMATAARPSNRAPRFIRSRAAPALRSLRSLQRYTPPVRADARTMSEHFSPIMIEGALVLPATIDGMIEASATRRPSMP
jgi:hypothetical protein